MRVYSLKKKVIMKGGGIIKHSGQRGCGLLLSKDMGESTGGGGCGGGGVVRSVPKTMDLSGLRGSLTAGGKLPRVKKQFINL